MDNINQEVNYYENIIKNMANELEKERNTEQVNKVELSLIDNLEYYNNITTESMLNDYVNIKENIKDITDLICRVELDKSIKCSKEKCIKSAQYKNLVTKEALCWYHAYIK